MKHGRPTFGGQDFTNFFLAIAGASAGLIGLLFVAVSIAPESTVKARAPVERRAVATSAYTALLNAFVISLGALIPQPQTALGGFVMTMASISLIDTMYVGWQLLRHPRNWRNGMRRNRTPIRVMADSTSPKVMAMVKTASRSIVWIIAGLWLSLAAGFVLPFVAPWAKPGTRTDRERAARDGLTAVSSLAQPWATW